MMCLLITGCGHSLSGKYTSESGVYSISFLQMENALGIKVARILTEVITGMVMITVIISK